MDNIVTLRVSALESNYTLGHFGDGSNSDIIFREVKNLKLHQIAFWPETLESVETALGKSIGIPLIPEPNKSIIKKNIAIMRIEPLKIWTLGSNAPLFKANEATTEVITPIKSGEEKDISKSSDDKKDLKLSEKQLATS